MALTASLPVGSRILEVKVIAVAHGVTLLWHDITERTNAEHELKRSGERLALAARRLAEAARETVVLADHSLVGVDASNRIVPMSAVAEVLTDAGSLPADRLQLAAQGSVVSIADHTIAEALGPPAAAPPPRPAAGRTAAA